MEHLARAAHDNLLDFYVWNHELHLPPGFVELYPQVKGTDYPVCLSNELLKQFIRDKYLEFFSAAPSVDGLVISVNESGQFSLLTDAGCRCDRCIRMTQRDRLSSVLSEVIRVTSAVSVCDNNLWGHALSKWDPDKRQLSASFFQPDDELIAKCRAEKQRGTELATEALSEIHSTRYKLPEPAYQRLRFDFEKLKDTAELWGHLLELYLRHRQVSSSPAKPVVTSAISGRDGKPLGRLLDAARSVLKKAVEMEHRHGNDSWPVISPDRGVSAYEFVNQILRHYIAAITGEAVDEHVTDRHVDHIVTTPSYQPDSVESLWRRLVECGRPNCELGSIIEVSLRWPGKLRRLAINSFDFSLTRHDGLAQSFPLAYPVQAFSLSNASKITLSIAKTPHHLVVREERAKADHLGSSQKAMRAG